MSSVQPFPVTVRIDSFRPNSTPIITAVTSAIDELFKASADLGKIVLASQIRTAIGTVPGVIDYRLVWPNDSDPLSLRPFQIYVFKGTEIEIA